MARSRDEDAGPGPDEGRQTPSTLALVEAAQAGDRLAFAALYRAHGRMVHGVLLTRLPRAELRDALQEVFVTALAKLDSLRDPARFAAWLAVIARHCANDWRKRLARTHERSWDPSAVDEQARPSPSGPSGEPAWLDSLALLDQLRALPEDYRELLILRFVEGLTGPELATILDMTPGSVRVKLHRGLELIRRRAGGRP